MDIEEEEGPFSLLPNEVQKHIFGYLTFEELAYLCQVCQIWNEIMESDDLWNKFTPRYSGVQRIEADTAKARFKKMWNSSVKIGKERWFQNPLVELEEYEEMFRSSERRNFHRDDLNSKSVLMLRLNPCYDFSELDIHKNVGLLEAMEHVFREYQDYGPDAAYECYLTDGAESVIEYGRKQTKKDAMESIMNVLEPYWLLENLDELKYAITEDGGLQCESNHKSHEGECEDKDANEDRHEDVYGDESNGELLEPIENKSIVKRVDEKLFYKLKRIIVDGSTSYVEFPLDDGSFDANDQFARSILISDKASFFWINFYEV